MPKTGGFLSCIRFRETHRHCKRYTFDSGTRSLVFLCVQRGRDRASSPCVSEAVSFFYDRVRDNGASHDALQKMRHAREQNRQSASAPQRASSVCPSPSGASPSTFGASPSTFGGSSSTFGVSVAGVRAGRGCGDRDAGAASSLDPRRAAAEETNDRVSSSRNLEARFIPGGA